jgi:hypothetical protein
MAYLVVDTFLEKADAENKAEIYRQAGRSSVEILAVDGITVNECTCMPCDAKFVKDGSPLYVVLARG